jgi:hypothetical protein
MPFERSILGYEPYDKSLQRSEYLFPFYPDDYITGMWATVSSGSMSGNNAYTDMHEDLLREAFCWRNRPAKSGSIHVLDPDVLQNIQEVYTLEGTVLEDEEIEEKYRDISIRVSIKGTAMDIPESKSDSGKKRRKGGKTSWWRLPATHFHLRCKTESGGYRSFYPSGYIFFDGETPILEIPKARDRVSLAVVRNFFAAAYEKPDNDKKRIVLSSDKTYLRVDWVYRIPVDCIPETMIFRRVVKADVDIEYKPTKDPKEQNQLLSVPLNNAEFKQYALKVKPPDR